MPPPCALTYVLFKFFRKNGRPPKPGELKIPVHPKLLDHLINGPKRSESAPAAPEVIVIDD